VLLRMIDIFRKLTIVHLRTLYPILLTRNVWSFFSLIFCFCKVCCKIVGHFDHKLKSWAKSGNLEGPIISCQLNLMQRKVHWPFQKKIQNIHITYIIFAFNKVVVSYIFVSFKSTIFILPLILNTCFLH
jgi:hypothetical protein